MRLIVANYAHVDLLKIWEHISQDNLAAADRLLDRFQVRFKVLRNAPESGEIRNDLQIGIRQAIVAPYVIFYEFDDRAVTIIRVIHGARQLPEAFHEPP